jgi:hypothetical protein
MASGLHIRQADEVPNKSSTAANGSGLNVAREVTATAYFRDA